MSESKEYWSSSQDQGNIRISEDVICSIAALAATETEGVAALSSNISAEIAEFLGKKKTLSKGIKMQLSDDGCVQIDVFLLAKFGYNVREIAEKVQANIASSVEAMAGIKLGDINIHITGVAFDKE